CICFTPSLVAIIFKTLPIFISISPFQSLYHHITMPFLCQQKVAESAIFAAFVAESAILGGNII
ncbi:MAG: hypothetical protein MJ053_07500, partial [Elusimicrobiaceae bacterium]|nr:hypothetical protein [Elusimicrobiaceae bacterium]